MYKPVELYSQIKGPESFHLQNTSVAGPGGLYIIYEMTC